LSRHCRIALIFPLSSSRCGQSPGMWRFRKSSAWGQRPLRSSPATNDVISHYFAGARTRKHRASLSQYTRSLFTVHAAIHFV
jgi:hypothetical protein